MTSGQVASKWKKLRRLRFLRNRLRHAVGGEDHRRLGVGDFGEFLDEDRALGLQALDHVAVVHDLVADIDRRAIALERLLDRIDRPHHAGAEAARRAEQDLQRRFGGIAVVFGCHRREMRFRPPACQDEPPILAFQGGKCLYSGEFQSSMMTMASSGRAGGAQRRFTHARSAADAESDRRLAGGEHRAVVRPGRRILQAASARSEGHRRWRRRPGDQGPRSDPDRAADPRGDREGRRRSRAQARSCPSPRSICRRPSRFGQEEGPALHAGVPPPGSAERDSLADPQSSRAQGRPDHAAGRNHQVDHRGHPRPHPLERREPQPARSGDARPVLADRSRFRSAARLQGEAGAGRQRRYAAARRGHHRAAGARRAGDPGGAKAKDDLDTAAVFAKLKQLGGKAEDKDEE